MAVVLLTLVGGAGACAPAGEQGAAREDGSEEAGGGSGTPSDTTNPEGSQGNWIGGTAVGSRVDTQGSIPPDARGGELRVGQRIYVSVEIGEEPPPATVHAVFRDAAGRKVAEDAKKVPARAGPLYFDSGETSDWAAGEGTITLSVDGRQVAEESFALREPTSADPAEGSPAPPG